VTLTEHAASRLDIQTVPVQAMTQSTGPRTSIPYSAVIYDLKGQAWAYTTSESNVFVRHALRIDVISGSSVVLLDGPPVGTRIVTTGVAELYGSEFGVGH
jgi:hypothetical protein